MGVYAQLSDDDQKAVSQLARYLIETPGNRFYEQNLIAVRNHIAGNDALVKEAHKFHKKFAEIMSEQAQALATIAQRAEQAATGPVKEMMQRYSDPKAQKTLQEKIKQVQKERAKKKK